MSAFAQARVELLVKLRAGQLAAKEYVDADRDLVRRSVQTWEGIPELAPFRVRVLHYCMLDETPRLAETIVHETNRYLNEQIDVATLASALTHQFAILDECNSVPFGIAIRVRQRDGPDELAVLIPPGTPIDVEYPYECRVALPNLTDKRILVEVIEDPGEHAGPSNAWTFLVSNLNLPSLPDKTIELEITLQLIGEVQMRLTVRIRSIEYEHQEENDGFGFLVAGGVLEALEHAEGPRTRAVRVLVEQAERFLRSHGELLPEHLRDRMVNFATLGLFQRGGLQPKSTLSVPTVRVRRAGGAGVGSDSPPNRFTDSAVGAVDAYHYLLVDLSSWFDPVQLNASIAFSGLLLLRMLGAPADMIEQAEKNAAQLVRAGPSATDVRFTRAERVDLRQIVDRAVKGGPLSPEAAELLRVFDGLVRWADAVESFAWDDDIFRRLDALTRVAIRVSERGSLPRSRVVALRKLLSLVEDAMARRDRVLAAEAARAMLGELGRVSMISFVESLDAFFPSVSQEMQERLGLAPRPRPKATALVLPVVTAVKHAAEKLETRLRGGVGLSTLHDALARLGEQPEEETKDPQMVQAEAATALLFAEMEGVVDSVGRDASVDRVSKIYAALSHPAVTPVLTLHGSAAVHFATVAHYAEPLGAALQSGDDQQVKSALLRFMFDCSEVPYALSVFADLFLMAIGAEDQASIPTFLQTGDTAALRQRILDLVSTSRERWKETHPTASIEATERAELVFQWLLALLDQKAMAEFIRQPVSAAKLRAVSWWGEAFSRSPWFQYVAPEARETFTRLLSAIPRVIGSREAKAEHEAKALVRELAALARRVDLGAQAQRDLRAIRDALPDVLQQLFDTPD